MNFIIQFLQKYIICDGITDLWFYFKILYSAFLFLTILMMMQSNHFYTRVGSEKKFSMLDLQFPGSSKYMSYLINGIYLLPVEKTSKVIRAVRCNLLIDFLFMPTAYGSIFLLCMHIADRNGNVLFAILAWLQVLAFAFDVIENIFILNKLKPVPPPKVHDFIKDVENFKEPRSFVLYSRMVILKWVLAITGFMCAFMMMFYYWLTNDYNPLQLPLLYFIISETIIFIFLTRIIKKYSKSI